MERLHSAQHAAHDAWRDADAALTLSLAAHRDATREKGSLRETLTRLEALILEISADLRHVKSELDTATTDLRIVKAELKTVTTDVGIVKDRLQSDSG